MDSYIIFTINGGAGKNVLATSVIKEIKKKYSDYKIVVITHYKDVWLYNPNVFRVYEYGNTPYFYSIYIKDNPNVKIFSLEPYSASDYQLKKKHLAEIWCDLYGVEYNNEMPELFFNQREIEFTEKKFELDNRPVFLIQTNGGMNDKMKISWMRDMPLSTAQEVVNIMKGKGYRVIHITRYDQPSLNSVEQFKGNLRELMVLIKKSNKRLFIDSVCQHIATSLGLKSTVLWVRNSPFMLGYNINDNIVTKVEDEIDVFSDSIIEPYDILGNINQCPFKEGTKLFDTNEIIESIEKQK